MSSHRSYSSNTPWESIAGFSRALRAGQLLFVSGTTASDEHGDTLHLGDAGAQARHVLQTIARTLDAAGASLSAVVRTRVYLTRYEDWEVVARVHGEFFGDVRPANTLVVVRSLVPADALVEIEADAIVG
jgi:enamine deaminase RidA (YjgF/YER057c/UK114 family)